MGVLQKIRAGLVYQTVCVYGGLCHAFIFSRPEKKGQFFCFALLRKPVIFSEEPNSVIVGAMTPRCISKMRPIKQRANLFAGD
jgi:hypothetical protein